MYVPHRPKKSNVFVLHFCMCQPCAQRYCEEIVFLYFPSTLINACSSSKFNDGVNWSQPKCGNTFVKFQKWLMKKRTKKPQKLSMKYERTKMVGETGRLGGWLFSEWKLVWVSKFWGSLTWMASALKIKSLTLFLAYYIDNPFFQT